jgi:hypothetical protein
MIVMQFGTVRMQQQMGASPCQRWLFAVLQCKIA